ncbi:hypothetical protein [Candidatus Electronema sp. PJ]|uniref:hypothetical protein n=1 Tax=Candidatus Electronema sp. PJ TaxID=3401572 RepID=UPI003AA8FEB6
MGRTLPGEEGTKLDKGKTERELQGTGGGGQLRPFQQVAEVAALLFKERGNHSGEEATLSSGKTHLFYSVGKELYSAKLLCKSAKLLSGLLKLLCYSARLLFCRAGLLSRSAELLCGLAKLLY